MSRLRLSSLFESLGGAVSRRQGMAAALATLLASPAVAGAARRCRKNKECPTRLCDRKKQRCVCRKLGGACASTKNCCGTLACAGGACESCVPALCPSGCCQGGICRPGTVAAACGTGGAACVACSGSTAPFCAAQTCSPGVWTIQTTFGSAGSGAGQFSSPRGVFVSQDGRTAWIADAGNDRIAVWTRSGPATTDWSVNATFGSSGSGNLFFEYPAGVVASPDGKTAWIADTSNHRVTIWTRATGASTTWDYNAKFGGNGDADDKLDMPYGVHVSPDTLTAWVADTNNHRVSVWTRPDPATAVWSPNARFGSEGTGPGQFKQPTGVFVSANGLTAWVADSMNHRISVWTRSDAGSTVWTPVATFGGGPDMSPGSLNTPTGIVVAADGLTAWVADKINDRISAWSRPTAASTAWSHLGNFGAGALSDPAAVSMPAGDNVALVADVAANRISVWTRA